MKTRLGEVLRLSYVRISFVGHCDRFFEKKEKALYAWLSFGNGGIQSGVSGHVEEGKVEIPHFSPSATPFYHARSAIQTPSQLSAITVNSSTNIFTFINLHINPLNAKLNPICHC
jgi:hypothetical protein